MTRTALALSPHLDDAAFSCGALLAKLAMEGWRVVVATVFALSVPDPRGFALACQTDKGLDRGVDYMALRRAEDAEAMHRLGAEARHLPLPEAPHRGYGSAAELFAGVRADDRIAGAVGEAVAALLAEPAPALLLAPQAVGGHVDHVQLVRALDAEPARPPTLWWRDYPYAVREAAPAEPFGPAMRALPERAFAAGPAAFEAKRRAAGAYASQLGFQFGGPEALDRRLAAEGGVERLRADGEVPPLPVPLA